MSTSQRISAAIVYIPVIGWIYGFFQRKNALADFHLRQSIGLIVGLAVSFLVWAVVAWILTWIPFGEIFAVALFTLVMTMFIIGVIAWVVGIINALRGKMNNLPIFGGIARRIPL
jgi:uncharacterized membrane protein